MDAKIDLVCKYPGDAMRCPDCKDSDVFCDGEMTYQYPWGIDALGVIVVILKGYYGECEKCKKKIFNWKTKEVKRISFKELRGK
jgi:hypothetical protein